MSSLGAQVVLEACVVTRNDSRSADVVLEAGSIRENLEVVYAHAYSAGCLVLRSGYVSGKRRLPAWVLAIGLDGLDGAGVNREVLEESVY